MTEPKILRIPFTVDVLSVWAAERREHTNWPVVYTINDDKEIYVGETTNAELRMRQHLTSPTKSQLKIASFIIDASYNKSVCLDLESHLIRYFAADEKYMVLNGNGGITDADYFNRTQYRKSFDVIFEELVASGNLTRSIPDIVNSDLFKYSPFKALTNDQAIAIEGVLEQLFQEMEAGVANPIVIQGDPGTGKTIVAVYLIKLLQDIARSHTDETLDADSLFADFFQDGFREKVQTMKIGIVVPQLSLRETIKKVFGRTPGLSKSMVMTPFDVGGSDETFDLLIVDEAHRLQQRSNQPAAMLNKKFKSNNEKLFGADDYLITQLDWIKAKSKHQIYLLDQAQTVKPADLPQSVIRTLVDTAKSSRSYFSLTSQMRVAGGADYIDFIHKILHGDQLSPSRSFGSYDLRFFNSFNEMREEIMIRESESGLARLVAGFAWPWISRNGAAFDFDIEGVHLSWNRTNSDWINSGTSIDEVGSIHTTQGYDLNYAGVIIGPDLGFDPITSKLMFRRENYHDKKGRENNNFLDVQYSDDDLLKFVLNIYRVLLTRGIRGTYIFVSDPELRAHLAQFFA
jgi:hypothetical protein